MKRKTHFILANINQTKAKTVWWLDIPLSRLRNKNDAIIDFLLFDYRNRKLHHLEVPVSFMNVNLSRLVVQNGKVRLELSADRSRLFQDLRPTGGNINFRQHRHCSCLLRGDGYRLVVPRMASDL